MGDEISSTVSEEEKHNIFDEVDNDTDDHDGSDAAKELMNKFNSSTDKEPKEIEEQVEDKENLTENVFKRGCF